MKLKWGSYNHDDDSVGVKIRYQSTYDKFGRRIGEVQEWHIIGAIIGTDQADLKTKLASLEEAYNTDYKNLVLYHNDGTTESQHTLTNNSTFGGTHVHFFGYIEGPWKMQLEYANRRTFHIVIRGETRVGTGLYAWREQLTTVGTGGQKFRYMPSLNAVPELQIIQQSTTFTYEQEGVAIGRTSHPAVPAPVFPSIEHVESRVIQKHTPKEIRVGGAELYLIQWKYVMEATTSQKLLSFTLPGVSQ